MRIEQIRKSKVRPKTLTETKPLPHAKSGAQQMTEQKKECNRNLGICIPTYNRVEKLKKTLAMWISAVKEYSVPIYISDNASPDDTESVVKDAQKEYPYIFYSRNETNIGPDKNFEKVLKFADTKYRWLMGDDDKLDRGSISDILRYTEMDFDIIMLNFPTFKYYAETKMISDINELMRDFGSRMTFMSTIIFNERLIKSERFIEVYNSEFSKLNFAHLAAAFCYLADGLPHTVYFLADVSLNTISTEKVSWEHLTLQYFINNLSKTVSMLPDCYTQESKDAVCQNILKVCWGWRSYVFHIFNVRIARCLTLRWYFKSLKNIKRVFNFGQRLLIFCAAISPRFIIRAIVKYYDKKRVRRRNAETVTENNKEI